MAAKKLKFVFFLKMFLISNFSLYDITFHFTIGYYSEKECAIHNLNVHTHIDLD